MSKRIALLEGTTVVNIAVFPDDWTGDTWNDHTAITAPAEVAPGWTYTDGTFTAPPVHSLTGPPVIGVDDTALVVYRNTYDDAPTEVTFTVNGATETVTLTDGIAELEVIPAGPGDITVTVDQPVPSIIITVEETP